MVFRTKGMILNCVREVVCGPVNDVLVCQDVASVLTVHYFLIVIKNRECAKRTLTMMELSEKQPGENEAAPYLHCFSEGEHLCYLFDYRSERRLSAFAEGQMLNVNIREATCVNLVMECLSTPLPYPFLYLILNQGQVNIQKDNRIYFTPCVDLSKLDPMVTEAQCVASCARIVLGLLRERGRRKAKSYYLIEKKIEKSAYNSLPEIYRDIKVTAAPGSKRTLFQRLLFRWEAYRDALFLVLLVLSVIAAVFALVVLVSQLFFGDVPLFRLFYKGFDLIGTESLRSPRK